MESTNHTPSEGEKEPKEAEILPNNSDKKSESETKQSDIEGKPSENRFLAASAYLVFFLPILLANKDSFAMYHANQGLLLLLTAIAINIVGTFIPFFGIFFILPLGYLFVFVLMIIGIVAALKGEKKPLPVIGGYPLLDMLK
jgi:uncharacterized membrane protein